MPQTNLPLGGMFPLAPSSIPEIPLMKRTGQQGVCKIAVFAYERKTGQPVWQSGTRQVVSKAKDIWFFGTGPFQQGTIYEGTKFAGDKLTVPLPGKNEPPKKPDNVEVAREMVFADPAPAAAASTQQIAAQQPAAAPPQSPPGTSTAPRAACRSWRTWPLGRFATGNRAGPCLWKRPPPHRPIRCYRPASINRCRRRYASNQKSR